jgi:hypothetical protein
MVDSVTRDQALAFRVRAQQLDRTTGGLADTAVLDAGVQDTGPDGGRWALAVRGVDVSDPPGRDLVLAWTIRGAPHFYRRRDASAVATAVAPFSEADAAKRVFDASRPLKAAGIDVLTALDTVAEAMRDIVARPTVKGEVSTQLTARLDKPYLRYCGSCRATHVYEQPFRLAALRAGLELEPGTSPPVLRRIPRFRPTARSSPGLDVVRTYLRLLGPATHKQVAEYLDAPVKEVTAHWPEDVVEVAVEGERRWLLADDRGRLGEKPVRVTRLLGPYDLFLQARDRTLLVSDPKRAKALWPVLGRPGAVLVDGEIAGLWRPRQSGGKLTVRVEPWRAMPAATRRAVTGQAERLAAHRGVTLAGVDITD